MMNGFKFFVSFGPFFDLVCPVTSGKNLGEEKKPFMWILNYLCVPKIMTFRCFVGQFSLVTEGQNRHTKTDQCQIFMLTSTQICILHNGMAFSVISIIIWCQKYHRAPEIKFWTMTWHFLPLQKSMWQAVNLTLVKAVQFK